MENVDMSPVLEAIARRRGGEAPVPMMDQTMAAKPTAPATTPTTTPTSTPKPNAMDHSPEEARVITKLLIKELNKLL